MYPVFTVPADAPTDIEALGSKQKFWFKRPATEDGRSGRGEESWLFKAAREHTGEDWSEKVTAQLSALLGLPHATYELAKWTEETGSESKTWNGVVTRRLEGPQERLMLGNELLADRVNRYPRRKGTQFYLNPKYTLELTLDVLADEDLGIALDADWDLPSGVSSVPDVFVGYLLLDAWIGNTDRHDNNWGVIERSTPSGSRRILAPTFDHASSLGRELRDTEREERLTTNDQNRTVRAYVQRCRSAFYLDEEDDQPMHPTRAFFKAAEKFPPAASAWLQQLDRIDQSEVDKIFALIPPERISDVSIRFSKKQLSINRNELKSGSN